MDPAGRTPRLPRARALSRLPEGSPSSDSRADSRPVTFLARLRERKLVQWALAYLAGAWLALEVYATLQEGFGWPPRFFPVAVAVLVAGLGVTLVLAWYHGERGRQGVSGAELVIIAGLLLIAGLLVPRFLSRAGHGPVAGTQSAAAEAGVRETVDAVPDGARSGTTGDPRPAAQTPDRPPIAVLPFENVGGAPEDLSFVDGIHAEVLTQLYKIHSLDTKSQTSVLRYRDSPEHLPAIAGELGVRYIVEAGVQRAGGTIRIGVRLFDAPADRRLWTKTYDGRLTVSNVLDLQRQIAIDIATRLGAEVLPGERSQLSVEAPENLSAYESYLDGLYHLRTITLGEATGLDSLRRAGDRAIESLREAIAAEPRWAPPRAALGRVYHFLAGSRIEPDVYYPLSRASLDTALALDSLHAPAWASLGFVLHNWQRDFAGAEAAYRRAAELGWPRPWGYGYLLLSLGRFPEAVRALQRTAVFDPYSRSVRAQIGWAYACGGDYSRAIEQLEGVLAGGGGPSLYAVLGYAYLKAGNPARGLAQIEAMDGLDGAKALVYALADSTERAGSLLSEAELTPLGNVLNGVTPAAAVALGDPDRALDYLEREAEAHPANLLYIQCLEELRSLEGNPRYERVLERVGFPRAGG